MIIAIGKTHCRRCNRKLFGSQHLFRHPQVALPRMEALAHKIRGLVYETLRQHGADSDTPRETLLIRDGAYCGHRYCLGEFHAVWFIEEDEIKFYGADGGVIQLIQPSDMFAHRAA